MGKEEEEEEEEHTLKKNGLRAANANSEKK